MKQAALELQCSDRGFSTSGCHEGLDQEATGTVGEKCHPPLLLISFHIFSTHTHPDALWVHLTRAGPETEVRDGACVTRGRNQRFPVKRLEDEKRFPVCACPCVSAVCELIGRQVHRL